MECPSILAKDQELKSAEATFLEMLESVQQSCETVRSPESIGYPCSTQTNIISNDQVEKISTAVKVVCTSLLSLGSPGEESNHKAHWKARKTELQPCGCKDQTILKSTCITPIFPRRSSES